MSPWPMLFFVGLAVGGYGTIVGAGGGFLLVPILLFLYPSEAASSIATLSLAVVALSALSGTIAYARTGRIDYGLGIVLAAGSIPAAMVGAWLTRAMPRGLFEITFGGVLVIVAVFLLRHPERRVSNSLSGRPQPRWRVTRVASVTLSVLAGALSGLLGIGGSPLQVAILTHVECLAAHTAMPTAQFLALATALAGVAVHFAAGDLYSEPVRLIALGLGAMAGAQLGAPLSSRVDNPRLVRLLAAGLLVVGLRLLVVAGS